MLALKVHVESEISSIIQVTSHSVCILVNSPCTWELLVCLLVSWCWNSVQVIFPIVRGTCLISE